MRVTRRAQGGVARTCFGCNSWDPSQRAVRRVSLDAARDDGEGKPEAWTVTLANLLQVAQYPLDAPPPKTYAN